MKKSILAMAFLSVLGACGPNDNLAGDWVQPVPGMEEQIQGIRIEKDGKAQSINMHTLVYEKWERQGDSLILSGKSIGNGQTLEFADKMTIKELTLERLVLESVDGMQIYRRPAADEKF